MDLKRPILFINSESRNNSCKISLGLSIVFQSCSCSQIEFQLFLFSKAKEIALIVTTFREGVRKRSSENAKKAKEANVTDKKKRKICKKSVFITWLSLIRLEQNIVKRFFPVEIKSFEVEPTQLVPFSATAKVELISDPNLRGVAAFAWQRTCGAPSDTES